MIEQTALKDRLFHGDSIRFMQRVPSGSVDLVVTDPPYLVNYKTREGKKAYKNDDPRRPEWLNEIFNELYRVLKPDAFCLSFYGYPRADAFLSAFRQAGFSMDGHFVWHKPYASSRGYTQRTHEAAYLLTKGRPQKPHRPIPDVLPWGKYTGNRLHPCQKPVSVFRPIIEAFSKQGDLILDPFAGSASTAVAARELGRHYLAIELEWQYYQRAWRRLHDECVLSDKDAQS